MGKIKGARAPSSSFLFPPSLSLSHPFFSLRFQPSFSTHKNTQTGKKLYWNEYGVGGGTTQDGKNKAITAQQAAATPFFGVSGRYNRSRDPWTLFDPATPNPVRDYLRYFYGQTLNYASSRVSWSWRESFFFVGSFFERKKEEMKKNAHVFSSFRLSLFSSSLLPQIPLSSEGTAVDAPFETPDTQTLRQKKPALTPSLSLSLSFSTPPTKTTAATSAAALFGLGGGAATKEKTDTVYDFTVTGIDGNKVPLSKFKGKVLVIVNVASACGFTPQYSGFQELVAEYGRKGLEVLFFPCNQFGSQEPGSNADVKSFAAKQGFKGVMLAKVDVNGPSAEPLFQFMKQKQGGLLTSDIKWNFSKFLVDREGNVVGRYASTATPESLKKDIEKYL